MPGPKETYTSKTLNQLLEGLAGAQIWGPDDLPVTGIAYHSGQVKAGQIFVALRGSQTDGHLFVHQAIQQGARVIVSEKDLPSYPGIVKVRVPDARLALAYLAAAFYQHPSQDLSVVGITGTNGKTTTSYILEAMMLAAGLKVGVIGTVNCRFGTQVLPAPVTTPESLDLQRMLQEMHSHRITHVLLEVSSHALDLKRAHHCHFAAGIFTNLSQDHLDYHGDLDSYFAAKCRLFTELLSNGRRPQPLAVINRDDPRGWELLRRTSVPALTYGLTRKSDLYPEKYHISAAGLQAWLATPYGRLEINSPLVGCHNLYNVMAASATALGLGLSCETIVKGVGQLAGIDGRLERIAVPGQPLVFVDYAHTPDALGQVLAALRALDFNRLITVFGCGGDRDRSKRPLMGQVAAQASDLVIVTSDNPRTEEPLAIIAQIEAGLKEGGYARLDPGEAREASPGYLVIPDRRQAIHLAVALGQPGDAVLVAGKGHETYQIIGTRRSHFDDRKVVWEALRGKQNS
ncbi:MAG: UDP-N-acetylmuramoyl-L-alanyl-D-glutamate--2,6-diaminopimelate ligase [Desulfobacteraceae bacterium]